MSAPTNDKVFTSSVAKLYESHLVPLIFESYAADIAARVANRRITKLLEVAAGTGVVTRQLASVLPDDAHIVATDLNQSMLDAASAIGTRRPVEWRQADAMRLPFADASFDAIVCQFGAMFFPDKARAFAEMRRVLRPRGMLLFNVWDRIEENDFASIVTDVLANLFPQDPPLFLARTPHGYYERDRILRDVADGGFGAPANLLTLAARSRASSAHIPAVAYCQGTPLRNEIEALAADRLGEITEIAAEAIAQKFGRADVDGKIQAHVVSVEK